MFLSKLKIYIFWSIVDLECYVSFYCTRTSESVIHTLIYIPSFQPFLSIYIYIGHYRVEKSSLCYRKGLDYVHAPSLIISDSLQPHGLEPTRLFCPWDSSGKNTGVSCHALLWGSSRAKDQT